MKINVSSLCFILLLVNGLVRSLPSLGSFVVGRNVGDILTLEMLFTGFTMIVVCMVLNGMKLPASEWITLWVFGVVLVLDVSLYKSIFPLVNPWVWITATSFVAVVLAYGIERERDTRVGVKENSRNISISRQLTMLYLSQARF